MSPDERAIEARDMEVYAAMVDYMDEQIKGVLEYLKAIGEYENTMILFFSDNGANGHPHKVYPGQTVEYLNSFDNSLENRGLMNSYIDMGPGWAQASMAPSRMFKAFPSEGGIRSPLIVKSPGKPANAASMNHAFIHVRDIMPTLLDVACVSHSDVFNGRKVRPLQGRSVLYLFEGKATSPYAEAGRVGYELFGLRAFFDGDWKILWMPKPFGKGDWELLNLKNDPGELNDLSKLYPDKCKDLIALWEQYKIDNGVLDISMDLSGKK
jgi:arylsulfatase